MPDSSPSSPRRRTPSPIASPTPSPTTPPLPDVPSPRGTDLAIPQKREREVSLEPATPHPDDLEASQPRLREKDARTPAKKNRVAQPHLSSTAEEDIENDLDVEADPALDAAEPGAHADSPPESVSGSPPHETKMRQISQGVEDIHWRSGQPAAQPDASLPPPLAPQATLVLSRPSTPPDPTVVLEPPPSVTPPEDELDKGLKRKLADRAPSHELLPDAKTEPTDGAIKRPRDEDKDENPRETKRPSPPPAPEEATASGSSTLDDESIKKTRVGRSSTPSSPRPKSPLAKSPPAFGGGFLAYASTASPFASVKGPSLFGSASSSRSPAPSSKPASSPFSTTSSPFASNSTANPFAAYASASAFAAHAASPFGAVHTTANNPSSSGRASPEPHTPSAKRTFSSTSSSTAVRAKSPVRSKSPVGSGFSAYAGGGAQGMFGSGGGPATKRARAATPGEVFGGTAFGSGRTSEEESRSREESGDSGDGDGTREKTFGERLRESRDADEEFTAEGGVLGPRADDDEGWKASLTAQELVTGEEDEEIKHHVRGKLFVLSSQNQWKERGTGTLRLNKRHDGGAARIVMRKDAVYTVLLNVTLFRGMSCFIAQDPRYLRFSVIEDGGTTHYNLRVSNAAAAATLLAEINKLIPGSPTATASAPAPDAGEP
ncbi:hypothetical protein BV25DRAFT_1918944 [Artomyces pyxidatus]|uniref:Uncharacterized protein n=1 Tax=Artomyces pyxidatus TaxID=48021 RepID=A0ACB8SQX8_9AGAM|nr:hypothetical protein BV25DRAFT_1918944 [Artomyces pyxidatus]